MKKILLLPLLLLNSNVILADPKIHIGGGGGYSSPAVSSFIDKDTDSKITLKGSKYYHGRIGYEFAPGMHIELDNGRHPDYELDVELPNDGGKATAKASYCDIHTNIIYDFNPLGNVTPFFLFGLGAANLDLDAMIIKHEAANLELFKSDKQKNWFKSWNAALGINIALGAHIDFEITGKFLVIHDVTVDYKKFDTKEKKIIDGKIEKTIANWQFGAGLKIKF
jgi:hypothetical protein